MSTIIERKTSVPQQAIKPLSVLECLEGKNIFITGATGFVGKALVEKILRSVPNCGKVCLLVRPRKGSTVWERVEKEIINSEIFNRLRSERDDFESYARAKLMAFPGELTQPELGLSQKNIAWIENNMNIFFHLAAITDFNERIDRAIELNVLGSTRCFGIAQRCKGLKAYVHMSTCYVNSNKRGWIDERLYDMGFDVEQMLSKAQTMTARELDKVTGSGMDWPNTYTFTKCMAEHLLASRRGTTPLGIIRPSIVGSSWKEPVPGWVDVITAAGAVYVATGLGVLKFLPGSPDAVADVVPVDYVVNACLNLVPAVYEQDKFEIMHAGSSSEKPMHWGIPAEVLPPYFNNLKPARAVGPCSFDFIQNQQLYQLRFFAQYSVPSALLNSVSSLGSSDLQAKAALYSKLVWRVRVLVESFRYFVENEWQFDNRNVRRIYNQLSPKDRELFPTDLSTIHWHEYSREFGYGLMRFVLKEPLVESTVSRNEMELRFDEWEPLQPLARKYFPNAHWVVRKYRERKKLRFKSPRTQADMIRVVLKSKRVQAAIEAHVVQGEGQVTKAEVEQDCKGMATRMFGAPFSIGVLSSLGFTLRKLWQQLYKSVTIDNDGLAMLRAAVKKGPMIYMPTHRSYIDFLMTSFMCYNCDLPLPYIAAGEDFLGIFGVRWVFRKSGAFFIRRSFSTDRVYTALFQQYVVQLLQDGQSLEFFIEGTRSRSGKMLHPKFGMLGVLTRACIDGELPEVSICPIAVNYERTLESGLYSNELSGNNKIKESLSNLFKSRKVLGTNFGRISMTVSKPRSLKESIQQLVAEVQTLGYCPSPYYPKPDEPSRVTAKEFEFKFNPSTNLQHKQHLDRRLGYSVVWNLQGVSECMPTHVVATLMLMYRQGVTKDVLVQKVHWLVEQIQLRGGNVRGYEMQHKVKLVEAAVTHLKSCISYRSTTVLEPNISARENYNNMLFLGQYKNKIISLFYLEALWACALYAFGDQAETGVDKDTLYTEVTFLYALLHQEFHFQEDPDAGTNLLATLDFMVEQGIFKMHNSLVEVSHAGESHFSFLCQLLWPFIDSYYISAMCLYSLQPDRAITEEELLTKTQWLATTLYYDLMVSFYESCSSDTCKNAIFTFGKWGVLQAISMKEGKKVSKSISLTELYKQPAALEQLLSRIDTYRKKPPVGRKRSGRNLVADLPILANL